MDEGLSWLERAERLVQYHEQALDFVRRAGEQLPTFPGDAHAVSRLWVEAEQLDGMICQLLNEMNEGLFSGKAEMDTTRGASMRTGVMDDKYVAYECSWSLVWDETSGVSIVLAIDPRRRSYEANVHSLSSRESQTVRFPINEAELKEALVDVYVSEATLNSSGFADFGTLDD